MENQVEQGNEAMGDSSEGKSLVEKVANVVTLMDHPADHDYDIARDAISVVLKDQSKWHPGPGGVAWFDAVKAYARENGVILDEEEKC